MSAHQWDGHECAACGMRDHWPGASSDCAPLTRMPGLERRVLEGVAGDDCQIGRRRRYRDAHRKKVESSGGVAARKAKQAAAVAAWRSKKRAEGLAWSSIVKK